MKSVRVSMGVSERVVAASRRCPLFERLPHAALEETAVEATLVQLDGGERLAVSNLIREGKTNQILSVMQTGRAAGNVMLDESLANLVASGRVGAKVTYEQTL